MKTEIILLGVLWCLPLRVSGQINSLGLGLPWPRVYEAVVKTSVTYENNDFYYSYTVCNSTKNSMYLYVFQLDLRLDPLRHQFSRQDLTVSHTAFQHQDLLTEAKKVIVRSNANPSNWTSHDTGLWGMQYEINKNYMVAPGKCMSGFVIVSTVPPSLREFIVEGYEQEFFESPESYNFKGTAEELMREVGKGVQYLGKTIAPVMPPEPFTASSWVARMKSDAIEARTLGWIKTDKSLAEIKKLISKLNTTKKSKLKYAVENIEQYALSEKAKGNLTDEADALIRLNALYLLQRSGKEESSKK